MIDHPAYPVEPWTIRETEMHLDALASSESVFALSNGHIGLRGNLDEGEPYGLPGTYLGGFYETRPLPYAEAGFGYPEDGQTVVNVTNGKLIRLLVEDEPFDLRYGNLISHERVLDLRDGVLRRTAEWVSPTGRRVKVSSTRFVSFTHRAIAAIEYIVEPLDESFPVVTNSFDLLTFGPTDDATMPDVVWAEHVFSAIYFEGEADTFQYHLVFRAMSDSALDSAASLEILDRIVHQVWT